MKKTTNILVVISIVGIIATLIAPFISSIFLNTGTGGRVVPFAPTTGKQITCTGSIRNPVLHDQYSFENLECETSESLFCSLPFSIAPFSLLRSDDDVLVRVQAQGLTAGSKAIRLSEGTLSGTLTGFDLDYCVPKQKDKVTLEILNKDSMITDSREMSV